MRNDALVDIRISSLAQSYNYRIENARRQMAVVTDERVVRMRRSQIDNLQGTLSAKKREIEAKREVSVSYDLVASGFVRFVALPGTAKADLRVSSSPERARQIRKPFGVGHAESVATELQTESLIDYVRQIPAAASSKQGGSDPKPSESEPAVIVEQASLIPAPMIPPPKPSTVQPKPEPKAPTKAPKNKSIFDRLFSVFKK